MSRMQRRLLMYVTLICFVVFGFWFLIRKARSNAFNQIIFDGFFTQNFCAKTKEDIITLQEKQGFLSARDIVTYSREHAVPIARARILHKKYPTLMLYAQRPIFCFADLVFTDQNFLVPREHYQELFYESCPICHVLKQYDMVCVPENIFARNILNKKNYEHACKSAQELAAYWYNLPITIRENYDYYWFDKTLIVLKNKMFIRMPVIIKTNTHKLLTEDIERAIQLVESDIKAGTTCMLPKELKFGVRGGYWVIDIRAENRMILSRLKGELYYETYTGNAA